MKKVILTITDHTGVVNTEAVGYTGGECNKATRNLYEMLGQELIEEKKMKPDSLVVQNQVNSTNQLKINL